MKFIYFILRFPNENINFFIYFDSICLRYPEREEPLDILLLCIHDVNLLVNIIVIQSINRQLISSLCIFGRLSSLNELTPH